MGAGQGRAAGYAKPGKMAPSSPSTLRASLRTVDLWVPSLEALRTPAWGRSQHRGLSLAGPGLLSPAPFRSRQRPICSDPKVCSIASCQNRVAEAHLQSMGRQAGHLGWGLRAGCRGPHLSPFM